VTEISEVQRKWVNEALGIFGLRGATADPSLVRVAKEVTPVDGATGEMRQNGRGNSAEFAGVMGGAGVQMAGPAAGSLNLPTGDKAAAPQSNTLQSKKESKQSASSTSASPPPKVKPPKWARVTHLDMQKLEYDFGRPISKEQAAELIFQDRKLPAEAKLEPGPGKNSWTLKAAGLDAWDATLKKMRARVATYYRGKVTKSNTEWIPPEPDVEIVEWTDTAQTPGGFESLPRQVKVRSSQPGKMELDFGRPLTKEQAGDLIFIGGEPPDDVQFVPGPGSNKWTLQWDGPTRPKSLDSRLRSPSSSTESEDGSANQSVSVATWNFEPPKVAGRTQRKDLKNDFGFKITKHYKLDEGKIPERLVKQWKVGEGHGYELAFEKPATKDQVMDKLFVKGKLGKFDTGFIELKGVPYEPATIWQVHIMGVDAIATIKPGIDIAIQDANVYAIETIAPSVPPGIRAHIENKTVPKDAKHHSPNVYVWEQEDHIARVETDGKGKSGSYQHEVTALDPTHEPTNITMRYFMIEQGLPSREAWQEFIKHWDEIHRQILAGFALALAGARMPGKAPAIKPSVRPTRTPVKKPAAPQTASKPQTPAAKPPTGSQKPTTDIGNAPTQPGVKPPPERGRPLDSTVPGPNQKQTVDTGSSGSSGGGSSQGSSGGGPPKKYDTMAPKNLPNGQKITINTSKGPKEMTVGQYRQKVDQAKEWMGEQRRLNGGKAPVDETTLGQQAADRFGLNKGWASVNNPYIY